MKKINVVLLGYGKMGKAIEKIIQTDSDISISHLIDTSNYDDGEAYKNPGFLNADIAIDFSHPTMVLKNIKASLEAGIPIVVGTTGWLEYKLEIEKLIKQKNGRLIYGSNFSLGVQLFNKLIAQAAQIFGNSPLFDASLHEVHHTQKADAPSGTALTLAQTFVNKSSTKKEIETVLPTSEKVKTDSFYVTSQRLGAVFGEHDVRIYSEWDDITISHKARNRDGFAAGAVKAAKWLVQNPNSGFYLIEDVAEQVIGF